jgi:hypothetical protein
MQDINNFSNLIEVRGRTFDQLQEKLIAIEVPCSILELKVLHTGQYVAILMADRKVRRKKKEEGV